MVESGVIYFLAALNIADIQPAQRRRSVVQQCQAVAHSAITEDDGTAPACCGQGGASTFDPGFDGEILKLRPGRVAHRPGVAVAIETESLTHFPRCISRVALQGPVVPAYHVSGRSIPRPPTHQSGSWRSAARTRNNGQQRIGTVGRAKGITHYHRIVAVVGRFNFPQFQYRVCCTAQIGTVQPSRGAHRPLASTTPSNSNPY